MRGRTARPVTRPQLRECPGCGLFQTVPALEPGTSAHCARCPTVLRRVSSHSAEHLIALAITAVVLLIVMSSTQLMSVEKAGISHVAGLFSGPEELVHQNMVELAAVVIFVTVVAPFAGLLGTVYVLIRARGRRPSPHVRRIFALAEEVRSAVLRNRRRHGCWC